MVHDLNVRARRRTGASGSGGPAQARPAPRWGWGPWAGSWAAAAALSLLGCVEPAADDDEPVADDDGSSGGDGATTWSERIDCAAPTTGFDRLDDVGAARGLDLPMVPPPLRPCPPVSAAVVAEDLDGDGDVDVLLSNNVGFPDLFANDGTGSFTRVPVGHDVLSRFGRTVYGHAVVDLDGDGLLDVVVWGPSLVLLSHNEGGLAFSDFQPLLQDDEWPRYCIQSVAFGDVDGDLDLDLFVPRADVLEGPDSFWVIEPATGSTDLLLLNVGDGLSFERAAELAPRGGAGIALVAAFTDRDGDGDADLLAPSDRPFPPLGPTAFYRNDTAAAGTLDLVDDAPDVGADLYVGGMGIATSDLNADGILDYCITDFEPQLRCLVSHEATGTWSRQGIELGLATDPTAHPGFVSESWDGWSIEMVDLDNDGALDVAVAAGSPDSLSGPVRPDALWQGGLSSPSDPGSLRFEERSAETGFNLGAEHYGLATADFEGDGYRDIVIAARDGLPVLWSNPCGDGAWLEIDLRSPAPNTLGIGARIITRWAGGRIDVQEVQGGRGLGQSPARVHVGLGDVDRVESIEVRWSDGATVTADDVPTRRYVTVRHPLLD